MRFECHWIYWIHKCVFDLVYNIEINSSFTIYFFIQSGFLLISATVGRNYSSTFYVEDKRTVIRLSSFRSLVWSCATYANQNTIIKREVFSNYFLVNMSRSVNRLVYLRIKNFKDNLIFSYF